MGVAGSERRKGWWFVGVGCNGGCVGALGAREWVECVCVRVGVVRHCVGMWKGKWVKCIKGKK